jgi:hypothetical protein
MRHPDLAAEVQPEHHFHVNKGRVVKNIYELRDALIEIDDRTFHHHVTKEKNDFKTWVQDVYKDSHLHLAAKVGQSGSRIAMLAAVNKYITQQEKKEGKRLCEYKEHINCGLRDFIAGIVLGILIGIAIARLVF